MTQMPVISRFLKYVAVNTASVMPEKGAEVVTSEGQVILGEMIIEDLYALGVGAEQITRLRDNAFVVHLPSTPGLETAPHICFNAHMDTCPDESGDVDPQIHKYEGGSLDIGNGVTISEDDLQDLVGHHIITSDGTSLLGGDDKAGVASMVETIARLLSDNTPHGNLSFWFCVNEEVGLMDIGNVPEEIVNSWDLLWSIDGEEVGDVDTDCFYGRGVTLTFSGQNAHIGVAGAKVKPAHYAAMLCWSQITAAFDTPMKHSPDSEDPFVYIHNTDTMSSTNATLIVLPRSFEREEGDRMVEAIRRMAEDSAKYYGCQVQIDDKMQYVSTIEAIRPKMHLIEPIMEAHRQHGLTPKMKKVRGGTDAAMANMKYPNLPGPNTGTGGRNLHMRSEFLVMEELELVPEIMLDGIQGFAQMATQ